MEEPPNAEVDQNIHRIAAEGLRRTLECKVPQLTSSMVEVDPNHSTLPQQTEWASRLPQTLPPLLNWAEQHRDVLFCREQGPVEFQRYFVLVFLEQTRGMFKTGAFQLCHSAEYNSVLESRLRKFSQDVAEIVVNSPAIRNWLFHYYGSVLGLQGWLSRPGDLHSLQRLFEFLKYKYGDAYEVDVLFGQKMLSFMEDLGEELLGFPKNSEYQTQGILMLAGAMEFNHKKEVRTLNAERIFQKVLRVNRDVVFEYGEEFVRLMFYSVTSIRRAPQSFVGDDIMLDLLAHLSVLLTEKQHNPNLHLDDGPRAYLFAITLLLLVEVPEVDVKDVDFEEITLYGFKCSRERFRSHVRWDICTGHYFSMNVRLRIAKMIPRLFTGFTPVGYVDVPTYKCLELLTWLTMFPLSRAQHHAETRAIMLARLVGEVRRLCDNFIKNPSENWHGEEYLKDLNDSLEPLLTVVQEAVLTLPPTEGFRRYRGGMRLIVACVHVCVILLRAFKAQAEGDEEEEEEEMEEVL